MAHPEPIFIRGIMPRSGTNWVADILRLHPALVVGPNEIYEFPHVPETPRLLGYVEAVARSPHARAFRPDLFAQRLGDAWLAYLEPFAGPERRVVLKYPGTEYLEASFDFFPDARIVLVVRDGRDVVESALRSGFVAPPAPRLWRPRSWRRLLGPSDFRLLARRYAQAGRQLLGFEQHCQSTGRSGQVLRVHFERLLDDTRGEVERLLGWACLDLDAYPWSELDTLPVRGSSWGPGTEPHQTRGRWHTWPARRRKAFDEEAGATLAALGYDRSGGGAVHEG